MQLFGWNITVVYTFTQLYRTVLQSENKVYFCLLLRLWWEFEFYICLSRRSRMPEEAFQSLYRASPCIATVKTEERKKSEGLRLVFFLQYQCWLRVDRTVFFILWPTISTQQRHCGYPLTILNYRHLKQG